MASEIQIINLGLGMLGADRITGRSDESKGAREMDACFDHVRDAELRAHNWRFSLTRAELSALSSTPAFQYAYEYQLPTDCLKVIQVGEYYCQSTTDFRSGDEAPFIIEGRKLLTDITAPLRIRYVRKMTADDAQQFDAAFVLLLAARVADFTCEAITGSTSKREALMASAKKYLDDASRADAIETAPGTLADDSWLMARL